MKSILIQIFFLVFLIAACQDKARENRYDGFNLEQCKRYQRNFKKKYSDFVIDEDTKVRRPIDFVRLYLKNDGLINKCKFQYIYRCDVFVSIEGKYKNVFYSEVLHFENANQLDSVIVHIKARNTIDPFNLKLHTIYRVGRNTIICVNSLGFDVLKYENFLAGEFNKTLTIEVINPITSLH